ncbi:MAG: TIGR03067 domain-containing protein [Gemmatimonadota bacterium]
MPTALPSRPHLDHLRRQAKTLLAAVKSGDAKAFATLREFLPAAAGMSDAAIAGAGFRLADAQSAVARQSGFASWPSLSHHVEQLRSLEGEWAFASLEIEGTAMPVAGMGAARLLIDGDRFRMESPGANYEGVFNIDVETNPHRIDIEFVEGPEAGNWNYGIFRLQENQLELCLDMNGKPAPAEFRSAPRSGTAYELLTRRTAGRPDAVTGGVRSAAPSPQGEVAIPAEFEQHDSPLLRELQGEWAAAKLVRDGQDFPAMVLKTGRRVAKGNEVEISFGGQLIIRARIRLDEGTAPVQIDYFNLHGPARGSIQHGIMAWDGKVARFCMAAPDAPRPADFSVTAGDGRTLSHWKRA